MELSDALHALRALGHPLRLRAFRELVRRGNTGLVVGDLRELLQIPPATLSAHLNVLRAAGLVRDQRESRAIRLFAQLGQMNSLLAYLTENCCEADASDCALPRPCKETGA